MVPNCAYGIDLGTSNIKIYSLSDDSVMMEKNMIAIENKKNIFAYGNSAYEMYEKPPQIFKSAIRFPTVSSRISTTWNG